MAIINMQKRLRELGRIRIGAKNNRGNPIKLEKFRLTSKDKHLLDHAAEKYGGVVKPWDNRGDKEFELFTEAAELPFMLSHAELGQYMELWTAGGCERRCDTQMELISGQPCICAQIGEDQCKPYTHLPVILYELPDLGVWRLTTTSWNAAVEMQESITLLRLLQGQGKLPKGRLGIEQRTKRADNKTTRFPVPVIRIHESVEALLRGDNALELPVAVDAASGQTVPALPPGAQLIEVDPKAKAAKRLDALVGMDATLRADILANFSLMGIADPNETLDRLIVADEDGAMPDALTIAKLVHDARVRLEKKAKPA